MEDQCDHNGRESERSDCDAQYLPQPQSVDTVIALGGRFFFVVVHVTISLLLAVDGCVRRCWLFSSFRFSVVAWSRSQW